MGMPPARGQPPLDQAAMDAIAAARGQQRQYVPPDWEPAGQYERAQLTDEERAEAEKAAPLSDVCSFCIGKHALPSTVGCPRVAEVTFANDGKTITSVKFWPGRGWAKGRVALLEDLHEGGDDGE